MDIEDVDFQNLGLVQKMLHMQGDILGEGNPDIPQKLIFEHLTVAMSSQHTVIADNFFGRDCQWLNTQQPMSLSGNLTDRIIIMDFFTYCCINCIHTFPYLKEVEKKYPVSSGVVVIGVHSAKFPNEKNLVNLKNAILKNDINHPVVNDENNHMWNKFSVACWPTVLILGPGGKMLFALVGEVYIKLLPFLCNSVLEFFKLNKIQLNTNPLPLSSCKKLPSNSHLFYPGKVCEGRRNDSVVISNTGCHEILIVGKDGSLQEKIGRGIPGFKDGDFCTAMFNSPQGVAWKDPGFIYVADTGNHAIRQIDMEAQAVSTLLENHMPCSTNDMIEAEDKLTSPWDVCLGPSNDSDVKGENVLYIAAAGSHQIFMLYLEDCRDFLEMDKRRGKWKLFAGSGKEENRNNMYPHHASFAQPSGLCVLQQPPNYLLVADSESSSIRSISLVNGRVKAVVGGGLDPLDLFCYGDIDGIGKNVRLQHPLGICATDSNILYIADSYNHKIKLLNFTTKKCISFCGSGKPGNKTGAFAEAEFNEPGGICVINEGKSLLVADTNNHCMKLLELETKQVFEIEVVPKVQDSFTVDTCDCEEEIVAHEVDDSMETQDKDILLLNLKVLHDDSFSISKESLEFCNISIQDNDLLLMLKHNFSIENSGFNILLTLRRKKKEPFIICLIISITVYICKKKINTCEPKSIVFKIPIQATNEDFKYDKKFLSHKLSDA